MVASFPFQFVGRLNLGIDFFFPDKVSCSSGLFLTCDSPASVPWVLGSQVCWHMPDLNCIFSVGSSLSSSVAYQTFAKEIPLSTLLDSIASNQHIAPPSKKS